MKGLRQRCLEAVFLLLLTGSASMAGDDAVSVRKVLDVPRVGFFRGGDQGPEDFPFPSCLAAALDAMGQPIEWAIDAEPGKTWRNNLTNRRLLAATGMGFALLWRKGEPCHSAADLTQINDHDETIRRAFAYAGRRYEIVDRWNPSTGTDEAELFARVRASVDAGAPVIAFGVVGPPEACVIAGYDAADGAVIGWTFFPEQAGPLEPNGMFRKADWAKDTWKLVFIGERREPTLSDEDVVRDGADILRRAESADGGLFAGDAAFDAWRAFVAAPLPKPDDEADVRSRHRLHNVIVGTLAEARCYAGFYLNHVADTMTDKPERRAYVHGLRQAAALFMAEHDLMWDAWNALGGNGAPDAWKAFRDPANRAKIAAVLADAQRLDRLALRYLDRALADQRHGRK